MITKVKRRVTGIVPGTLYINVVKLVVNGEYRTISDAVEQALKDLVAKHKEERKRESSSDS